MKYVFIILVVSCVGLNIETDNGYVSIEIGDNSLVSHLQEQLYHDLPLHYKGEKLTLDQTLSSYGISNHDTLTQGSAEICVDKGDHCEVNTVRMWCCEKGTIFLKEDRECPKECSKPVHGKCPPVTKCPRAAGCQAFCRTDADCT